MGPFNNIMTNSDINVDCENSFFTYHMCLRPTCPVKTQRVKSKRLSDWFTQEILDTQKLRDNNKKLKTGQITKNYCNKTNALIHKAKRQYYSDSIINSKEPKHLWKQPYG